MHLSRYARTMIASLMMYHRPETAAAHLAYWTLIRQALADRDISAPDALSNDAPAFDVWKAPDLVLSQTCGMPYRLFLHDQVSLVGTPDYGLTGCAPGFYRSAIVVRRDDARSDLAAFDDARLAFNALYSQSGFAALYQAAQEAGFWFLDSVESGAHVRSAAMVANNEADIAAIDGLTWLQIQRYDPFADRLRVLAHTAPTPGLPYITARGADAEVIAASVAEAIVGLSAADRETLGLKGLIQIPKADYLAVPNPPHPDLRKSAI